MNSGDIKPNELQFCSSLIIDLKILFVFGLHLSRELILDFYQPTHLGIYRKVTEMIVFIQWIEFFESVGCIYCISLEDPGKVIINMKLYNLYFTATVNHNGKCFVK